MPSFASITVNDGEDTPVSHTFLPSTIDPKTGVAKLKESDGTPIGDNIVTMSLRETDQYYKGRLLLAMPVVVTETINGVNVPKVSRTAYADLNLSFDKTSTTQERDNVLILLSNMFAGGVTMVDGTFRDLEGIY